MPNGLFSLTLLVAMVPFELFAQSVGSPGPSENPFTPAPPTAYGQYGNEGSSEQRFPFDSQRNWVHGYFQELPAYPGHPFFRPYNYKDVLSQSQTAAGWGERPMMPYSQQFWHKYHDQATMLKTSQYHYEPMRGTPVWTMAQPVNAPLRSYGGWSAAPGSTGAVPQTANQAMYNGPYTPPVQNYAVMPDQSRGQMPPTYPVNAAAYQSPYGRGY